MSQEGKLLSNMALTGPNLIDELILEELAQEGNVFQDSCAPNRVSLNIRWGRGRVSP